MSDNLASDSETRANAFEEALVVFEPASGAIVYTNGFARELFATTSGEPDRFRARDLLPELADGSIRRFETTFAYPSGARAVEVEVEALDAGELARGEAVLARMRPHVEARADVPAIPSPIVPGGEPRLAALWSVVVRGGLSGESHVAALLHEAASGVGLTSATLSRQEGDEFVVAFADDSERVGTRVAASAAPAAAAVRRAGTFAVLDTSRTPEFSGLSGEIGAFLASSFKIGEESWALTLSATQARTEPFSAGDWTYVETVVEALKSALEKMAIDRRVQKLAYYDALTSLPNRMAILQRMDDAIEEARTTDGRMAVLFLDIDGFKGVNDTVGHRGGDIVLAEVAQRLRGTLRRDEYIGRLGGDEFAIVMPAVSERHEIDMIAQRIGGVLTFPFGVGDYRFSLSASIGVAIYPEDGSARDELLESADAAMYSAKDDGGSRVRFRASSDGLVEGMGSAAAILSRETRDSGYILCYQPVVDLATNRVVSAEALIRRIHPQHGLLAPERGWSIARDDAGRRALDRWVLREATAQLRTWQQAGVALRIDVNLAAFDPTEINDMLADPSLASHVRRLRIEIAQEQFVDPSAAEAVARFVEHCSANGVGFVLDGFDGGLATLSSLANLPIDAVKLGVLWSRELLRVVRRAPSWWARLSLPNRSVGTSSRRV